MSKYNISLLITMPFLLIFSILGFIPIIFKGVQISKKNQPRLIRVLYYPIIIAIPAQIIFAIYFNGELKDRGYIKCPTPVYVTIPGTVTEYARHRDLCSNQR